MNVTAGQREEQYVHERNVRKYGLISRTKGRLAVLPALAGNDGQPPQPADERVAMLRRKDRVGRPFTRLRCLVRGWLAAHRGARGLDLVDGILRDHRVPARVRGGPSTPSAPSAPSGTIATLVTGLKGRERRRGRFPDSGRIGRQRRDAREQQRIDGQGGARASRGQWRRWRRRVRLRMGVRGLKCFSLGAECVSVLDRRDVGCSLVSGASAPGNARCPVFSGICEGTEGAAETTKETPRRRKTINNRKCRKKKVGKTEKRKITRHLDSRRGQGRNNMQRHLGLRVSETSPAPRRHTCSELLTSSAPNAPVAPVLSGLQHAVVGVKLRKLSSCGIRDTSSRMNASICERASIDCVVAGVGGGGSGRW